MPTRTLGDQRWGAAGVNSAGDSMYQRVHEGGQGEGGYDEWTKDQLSAELENRGLAKSGNKDELIARLQEDDG